VEGHCDCMFFVNTYRWDFPLVAALIAPRPLLIANSDKDRIFPLDGVVRVHEQTRRIYQLYGKPAHLGLLITEGPHQDTQDLQVPTFRWFNRFLKNDDSHVEIIAEKFFEPAQLRVFEQLPADAMNTNIQHSFVPKAASQTTSREALTAVLRQKTFAGWPDENEPLDPVPVFSVERNGVRLRAIDFTSQQRVPLRLYMVQAAKDESAGAVIMRVLDEDGWAGWLGMMRGAFSTELAGELASSGKPPADEAAFAALKRELESSKAVLAHFAPRGIGLTGWTLDEKKRTHIRRRFMLLGQTLDGMRVWDIRRAIHTLHFVRETEHAELELHASGGMAMNALFAALYEPGVKRLDLQQFPRLAEDGPDYLNFLKVADVEQVRRAVAERAQISLETKLDPARAAH
jgi:hypothetical protein